MVNKAADMIDVIRTESVSDMEYLKAHVILLTEIRDYFMSVAMMGLASKNREIKGRAHDVRLFLSYNFDCSPLSVLIHEASKETRTIDQLIELAKFLFSTGA